jgi:hypothetical protein
MKKSTDVLDNLGSCLEVLAGVFVFFLIGAALTWWGWTILRDARASADWPAAPGVITDSSLEFNQDEDGDSYTPHVAYTYQVNGVSYESYTIKFGENTYSSERTAQEIIGQYPVGQEVTVFYDPTDPDSAILEPGVSGGSYIVLSVGLLFLAISLFVLLFFLFRTLWSWAGFGAKKQ